MGTTENLTAGMTEVRIHLLSCGHVAWLTLPVCGEINHCHACGRGVTVVHYLDDMAHDETDGTVDRWHVHAVQDWGGTQEHWHEWESCLTRIDAEAVGRDMIAADMVLMLGDPDAWDEAEAKYSAKYGTRSRCLKSDNVAPGWSAIFIGPCGSGIPGAPWWKAGQDFPPEFTPDPDPWTVPDPWNDEPAGQNP